MSSHPMVDYRESTSERLPKLLDVGGGPYSGTVAQLVEHSVETRGVAGSTPASFTNFNWYTTMKYKQVFILMEKEHNGPVKPIHVYTDLEKAENARDEYQLYSRPTAGYFIENVYID